MWLFGVDSWTAGETGETTKKLSDRRRVVREGLAGRSPAPPESDAPAISCCPRSGVPRGPPSSISGATRHLWFTLLVTPGCVFDGGALSLGERCRRLYSARGGKSRSSANVPAMFGWGTYGDRRLLRSVLLKPTTMVAVLRQPCRGESALRIRGMMWFDEF